MMRIWLAQMGTAVSRSPAETHPALSPAAKSPRVSWVDGAKGIGIILVVLGHVIRGLANNHIWAFTPTVRFLDGWIYAFHMPLFFFLSGLFLCRQVRKAWTASLGDKLRTIAYPYFVWSTITLIVKSPLEGITNHVNSLHELPLILYQPVEQYWFLYSLLVLSLIITTLLRLHVTVWIVFGLSLFVYPSVWPWATYGWVVLAYSSVYAIYITLGTIVGLSIDLRAIAHQPATRLLMIVAAGLAIASAGGISGLPYHDPIAPFLALAGASAIIALAMLFDRTKVGNHLQFLGRHSLEIYVAHTIASAAVRIALHKFVHVAAIPTHIVLGTLAGVYFPILLVRTFDHFGFRYAFILPAASRSPSRSRDPSLKANSG